eukprot:6394062-Pyramimonas_sp.AAC.1
MSILVKLDGAACCSLRGARSFLWQGRTARAGAAGWSARGRWRGKVVELGALLERRASTPS